MKNKFYITHSIAIAFSILSTAPFSVVKGEELNHQIESNRSEKASANPWFITPSMGYSRFDLTGDLNPRLKFKSHSAPYFSIELGKQFSDRFWFAAGLSYLQAGGEATVSDGSHATYNMNYYGLPLSAKYDAFRFNQEKMSIFGKASLTPSKKEISQGKFADGTTRTYNDDAGFVLFGSAGMGGRYQWNERTNFEVTTAYIRSLTNMAGKNGDIGNSGFSLTAGVGLAL